MTTDRYCPTPMSVSGTWADTPRARQIKRLVAQQALPHTTSLWNDDRKYAGVAFAGTVLHIVALPLVIVGLVEFSSLLTRKAVWLLRRFQLVHE